MLHIDGSEEVPAKDSREGKEEQADSDENVAKASQYRGKCILSQGCSTLSACQDVYKRQSVVFVTVDLSESSPFLMREST